MSYTVDENKTSSIKKGWVGPVKRDFMRLSLTLRAINHWRFQIPAPLLSVPHTHTHTYTHIHAHTALPCLATRKEGVCSTFSPRPVHKRIVRVTFPVFLCHSLGEMRELRASKEISLHFMARPFQDPLRFISPQWRDQTV